MKSCIKCKLIKNKSDFYINKKSSDGFEGCCKLCCRQRGREHYHQYRKHGKHKPKKSIINKGCFVDTTNYFAYMLGFLWADGNIYKRKNSTSVLTQLHIKHTDMIEIKPIFDKIGTWLFCHCLYRETSKLATTDKNLFNFLKQYDYYDKSSVPPIKILTYIPKKLHYAWLHGFFDGDGCIYFKDKNKLGYRRPIIEIAGPLNYDWGFAENLLNPIGINFKTYKYKININKKKQILQFKDYIYQDNIVGLSRKMNRFLSIVI